MASAGLRRPVRGKPEAVVCTEYEIDKQEATVVRGIFRAYADGRGLLILAKALNSDPDHREVLDRYFSGRTPPPPGKVRAPGRFSAPTRQ